MLSIIFAATLSGVYPSPVLRPGDPIITEIQVPAPQPVKRKHEKK